MVWQDITIMAASIGMMFSLIPMVVSGRQPPYRTSIPTAIGLLIIAMAFMTLGLWLSAFITSITSGLWFSSAIVRGRYE